MTDVRRAEGLKSTNAKELVSEAGTILQDISLEEPRDMQIFGEQLAKVRNGEVSEAEVEKLYKMTLESARQRRDSRNQSLTSVFEMLVEKSGMLTEFAKSLIKPNEVEIAHVKAAEFKEQQAKEALERSRGLIPLLRDKIKQAEIYEETIYEKYVSFWVDEKAVKIATANVAYDAEIASEKILAEEYDKALAGVKQAKIEAEDMKMSRMNSTDMETKAELVDEAYGAIISKIQEDLDRGEKQLKNLRNQNLDNIDQKINSAKIIKDLEAKIKESEAGLKQEQAKLTKLAGNTMSVDYTTQQKLVTEMESAYRQLQSERKEESMRFQAYEKYEQYFTGMIMSEEQTISDLFAFLGKFEISRKNRKIGVQSWVSQQQSANTLETTALYAPIGDKMDQLLAEQSLETAVAGRKATVEDMKKHADIMARNVEKTLEFITTMEKIRDEEEEVIELMKSGDYDRLKSEGGPVDSDIPTETSKPSSTSRRVRS